MFTKEGGVDIEEVAAERPEALAKLHVDPLEGFQPYQARRLIYGAGIEDESEQKQIAKIAERLYAAFVGADAMLCEINPLIVARRRGQGARLQVHGRRQRALQARGDRGDARPRGVSARGAEGAREGRHVRQARRRGRRARQRRRAGHVHAGRGRSRRRTARELLRPRRRRRRAGRGRRARDHQRGPAGQVDPVQHLRWDHPLRRGGARDPPGARADDDRGADRRATGRHECGGGRELLRDAAPENLHVEPTMLDAAKRAVELAA